MTVATVKAGLATLQAAIPGIKRAYQDAPRGVINDMDLPVFLNFAREATHNKGSDTANTIAADVVYTSRLYDMRLFVLPIQFGIPGEAEALTEPWVQTVIDYFAARPQLGRLAGVQDSFIVSDSGVKPILWADVPYYGVEFRLQVVEYRLRTYASYE